MQSPTAVPDAYVPLAQLLVVLTVPLPVPAVLTANVQHVVALNVAFKVVVAVKSNCAHAPVPLHELLPVAVQPAKVDPLLAVAVQAPISVPEAYDPVAQSVPETVPLPVPAVLTVNETPPVLAKVAVMEPFEVKPYIPQVPVPEQYIDPVDAQPVKVDPLLGVAVHIPIPVPDGYVPLTQLFVVLIVPLPVPFVATVRVQQDELLNVAFKVVVAVKAN